MKNPYKFQRPAGTRYIVNVNEWNKVFGTRGRWPFVTCHVFVDHGRGKAVVHFYYTWVAKIVVVVLFPVIVLMDGFRQAAEVVKDCWFQKTRRAFSTDQAVAGREDWNKLMKLIRWDGK